MTSNNDPSLRTSTSNEASSFFQDDPPDYVSFVDQPLPPYEGSSLEPLSAPLNVKTIGKVDTYVQASLEKLKWGRFQKSPACLIGIKVSIKEPANRSTLFSAHCKLSIMPATQRDGVQIVAFRPVRRAGPGVKPTQAGYAISIGSDTAGSTLRSAWQLEGKIETGESGKRAVTWDIESDLSTQAPLPKELRLGMIVSFDAEGLPFDMEMEVRSHFRSLMRSITRPKGDRASMTGRFQSEAGDAQLNEAELLSDVSVIRA